MSIVSLGGFVATNSSKFIGDALDTAIIEHVKRHRNLSISKDMAEEIKSRSQILRI
ncbi:MAG: rod shape-determining protein [Wolinella sp.]